MSCETKFLPADEYLRYVEQAVSAELDQYIQSRYLGFVIVTSVTVYEIAAKEIISTFANKKHKIFGSFIDGRFEKIDARIQIEDLDNDFVKYFGERYSKKFKQLLADKEEETLQTKRASMKAAYKNLIRWRHDFVHNGNAPTTTNLAEVCSFYELGKDVIRCFDEALNSSRSKATNAIVAPVAVAATAAAHQP